MLLFSFVICKLSINSTVLFVNSSFKNHFNSLCMTRLIHIIRLNSCRFEDWFHDVVNEISHVTNKMKMRSHCVSAPKKKKNKTKLWNDAQLSRTRSVMVILHFSFWSILVPFHRWICRFFFSNFCFWLMYLNFVIQFSCLSTPRWGLASILQQYFGISRAQMQII